MHTAYQVKTYYQITYLQKVAKQNICSYVVNLWALVNSVSEKVPDNSVQ